MGIPARRGAGVTPGRCLGAWGLSAVRGADCTMAWRELGGHWGRSGDSSHVCPPCV